MAPRRYLVIANQTLAEAELTEAIRQRLEHAQHRLGQLMDDLRRLDVDVDGDLGEARLPDPRGPWRLRAFMDGSILEVFVNERLGLTSRVYPAARQSGHTRAFARGGDASLDDGVMWPLSTATIAASPATSKTT